MEDPPPQPEKGLTAESTPEQMEDAWSEDPRWKVCLADLHVDIGTKARVVLLTV